MLPHDFPPWQTVYGYFGCFRDDGVWEQINDALREEAGRAAQPSAAIIDSQSVKCGAYDRFKMINGKKRHILVDVLGLLLAVVVHKANEQDCKGARKLLSRAAKKSFVRLQLIWADAAITVNRSPCGCPP